MTGLEELLERWLPIAGARGEYEVSNLGAVRSLVDRDRWGNVRSKDTPLVLSACGRGRYLAVSVLQNGKRILKAVHVLVCEAFHGPRPNGYHCSHLNGDARDNRAENLAWVTPEENEAHKLLHGTKAHGERQGIAKLTEAAARDIRARYKRGEGSRLARQYGVSVQVVVSVAHGRAWKHV